MLDTTSIRSRFPALARRQDGRPVLYFDNPAGTQIVQNAIDGLAHYLEHCNANEGGVFPTSVETDRVIHETRAAMADFLCAAGPEEIVFGQNMTSLTFHLSHAISRTLRPGDRIVTTRLEHDANISPWLALLDAGIEVSFIDINLDDATIDMESARQTIDGRTRLLAVGLASNALGTINPVRALADLAHEQGAWVFVDAVHYAPHGPIDVGALGADLLACSAYKFFGPHLGILWGRYEVLSALPAYHVRPSGDDPPHSWEMGTQSHESLAALLGTLEYLASLGEGAGRRAQLQSALERIRAFERTLSERLIGGLAGIPGCRVLGITDPARFEWRVPTASFLIDGVDPTEGARQLAARGIYSWAGNHYAVEPLGRLGLSATQRVGLTHYNTLEEIDLFVEAVGAIRA